MVVVLLLAGCRDTKARQKSSDSRELARSRALNEQGMKTEKLPEAIELFQRSVQADPFNGSAHNNLGVALMHQGDYYAAAQAFEQAIRLLPANPDPRLNLGLLHESIGQLDSAERQYEKAIVVAPESVDAIQSLARVRVRLGKFDARTVELLRQVVLRAIDSKWRDWARRELTQARLAEMPTTYPAMPSTGEMP